MGGQQAKQVHCGSDTGLRASFEPSPITRKRKRVRVANDRATDFDLASHSRDPSLVPCTLVVDPLGFYVGFNTRISIDCVYRRCGGGIAKRFQFEPVSKEPTCIVRRACRDHSVSSSVASFVALICKKIERETFTRFSALSMSDGSGSYAYVSALAFSA